MSDINELRAAAERGRKLYRESPAHVQRREQCIIMGLLSEAYLAEHPADDGEPVTEEWLKSTIGWIPVDGGTDGYIGVDKIIFCKGSENVYSAWLQTSNHYYDMRRIVRVYTRGDVRLLCRALGITLKEGGA